MSTLELLTGKDYLSHSSLSSWMDCGERYYLERIAGAPQQMSWWLVGGSSVHAATEMLDRGEESDPLRAWSLAWDAQYKRDVTDKGILERDMRAGGRKSKEWPNKEDKLWWLANGPGMVAKYVQWRNMQLARGWRFFEMPDGTPAVEVAVNIVLGDVLVKGYIDRVMVDDDGQARVIDLKSGGHTPASTLQLGIYSLGFEHATGIRPLIGNYYMTRKAELTEDTSLLHYTPELVGKWFAAGKLGIESEIFVPHVTSMCGTCSVRPYCSAFGAPLANALTPTTIATSA